MRHLRAILVGLILFTAIGVRAETVQDIQTLDGAQRNRLETVIDEGGSGDSGDVTTLDFQSGVGGLDLELVGEIVTLSTNATAPAWGNTNLYATTNGTQNLSGKRIEGGVHLGVNMQGPRENISSASIGGTVGGSWNLISPVRILTVTGHVSSVVVSASTMGEYQYTLYLIQDATGGWLVTNWNKGLFRLPGKVDPFVNPAANTTNVFYFHGSTNVGQALYYINALTNS